MNEIVPIPEGDCFDADENVKNAFQESASDLSFKNSCDPDLEQGLIDIVGLNWEVC